MRRLRDFSLCLCLLLLWPLAVNANDSWRQIQTEARGQTVWFNAWGGDPAVNRYLAWVSEEVKTPLRDRPAYCPHRRRRRRSETHPERGAGRPSPGRVGGSAVDQRRKLSHA